MSRTIEGKAITELAERVPASRGVLLKARDSIRQYKGGTYLTEEVLPVMHVLVALESEELLGDTVEAVWQELFRTAAPTVKSLCRMYRDNWSDRRFLKGVDIALYSAYPILRKRVGL